MTDADLIRFLDAQDQVYAQVIEELTKGCKRTHWMWFIFPQVAGLGELRWRVTPYGIWIRRNGALADPILGARLRQVVRLMTTHKSKSALDILGSPDDLKFRSCLTLFCKAASDVSDRALFAESLDQFYRGEPDARTLELLR
jgi:uncharacterized protein (DUF1810 family)